ncbi:uncharacterized protein SPAPADRAFT_60328 [Spathaspora passalidarum NRRL Y-27907]|uniref:methylated diphthine methylhydrolase n=1 Tax=Spathaspora passalidarum (strain NRRL Y-27907 / 11-Y1) TaxID=619300 RepID=G3AKW1_SPAPN|nr:uncharacterized protein SPAPADRAFT_60328 [Spathaspora passalidarum NRRL Y-27907]EGW33004.1 hypothetical protein SPAPADRAFT_60328 [Spathaspora passalidarum NRRL Y-27907]
MSAIPHSKRYSVTKTILPPCSLRIHPTNPRIIVIGTYKLEDSGHRHGSIDLYHYVNGTFTLKQTYATAGAILDIKFNPKQANHLISVDSIGHVMCWRITDNIELISDVKVTEEDDVLITSCFFSPDDKVLLTFTDGSSGIFDVATEKVEFLSTSHELECWTGAFGEGEMSHVVYTGGDDSQLIAHDLRTNEKIWSNRRHHSAGVVSILAPGKDFRADPYSLWTGCYDDHLRVFDLRAGIPRLLQEENLGGGVWRLIPSPTEDDNRLLVCCMYDGARIVETDENKFTVSRYFKEDHESMCYGGDWGDNYVATCSFYDNVVQTWSPDTTM